MRRIGKTQRLLPHTGVEAQSDITGMGKVPDPDLKGWISYSSLARPV